MQGSIAGHSFVSARNGPWNSVDGQDSVKVLLTAMHGNGALPGCERLPL